MGQANAHIDRQYEADLARVRERILLMGARVEEMIARSVRSLLTRDADLAHETIRCDHHINALEVEIDDLCLQILALRQPAASDLRFITTVLKFVTDLERIGDLAVNICERTVTLCQAPALPALVDVQAFSDAALARLQMVLDAFVGRDIQAARKVIEDDEILDRLYHEGFRRVLKHIMSDPTAAERGINMQSVLKYLERIGDHTTNLAELVIFMVKGEDIRHVGKR